MRTMLEIKNLYKGYNNKPFIHDINLTLERGQIHGLIGSNGSGKTTLLRCAAGIFKPQQGTVQYDGKAVYDTPEVKKKIAFMTEELDFNQIYSVGGIGRYYQKFYENFSMEKYLDLIDRFHVKKRKAIGTLSKGQRTKMVLSLAIASQPEYLLMDEPESGMDVESRKLVHDLLIEAAENNSVGILLTTHDIDEVERLCDVVTMIEHGEIFAQGSVVELMEKVQKWKGVWPEKITDQQLYDMVVQEGTKLGKISEFYTIGEREENERLLEKLGVNDLCYEQISLEEMYIAMKNRFLKSGSIAGHSVN